MTKKEITHTFAINVEKERTRLGLSQEKMAQALDMSLSSYKNLIKEITSSVSLHTLFLLYKLTGKHAFELIEKCVDEEKLLSLYRKLGQHQKTYLHMVAEVECALSADGSNEITVIVPTTNMEDGMIWDSCTYESVTLNKRQYPIADYAIRVTSNHLHPAYIKGDIVLINKRPPRTGDVGIFLNKSTGRTYLRKFTQGNPCLLEPINGYGNTFEVYPDSQESLSNWMKLGCVVARLR